MKYSLILLFFASLSCYSQVDSSYIRPLERKVSIELYTANNFLGLNKEINSKQDVSYNSNNPIIWGAGISVRNTILSLSYGYGFDFLRDKKMGKTQSVDFQYHYYSRRFIIDASIQRYTGFYSSDSKSNAVTTYPNLRLKFYGLSSHYIFNHKRFSYKAAFNQTEKQLKSSGTFLIGIQVYKTQISPYNLIMSEGEQRFRNLQLGISGGYAHVWVIKQNWTIGLSATMGINIGNERFSRIDNKVEVYPTFFPRFSIAYNCDSWALSIGMVNNILYPLYKNNNINIYSGNTRISFRKRLDLSIPIIDKLRL